MKPMSLVTTVLLLGLAACGDGVAEQETPSPAKTEISVPAEKVAGEAMVFVPSPTEEMTVKATVPSPTPAGNPMVGEKFLPMPALSVMARI
jgi:hypothetical protein